MYLEAHLSQIQHCNSITFTVLNGIIRYYTVLTFYTVSNMNIQISHNKLVLIRQFNLFLTSFGPVQTSLKKILRKSKLIQFDKQLEKVKNYFSSQI